MAANDDNEILQRLASIQDELRAAEANRRAMEGAAAKLQGQTIFGVASVLFVLGSIVVLLLTDRPSLLILVAVICYVGTGIALIGRNPNPDFRNL